MDRLRIGFLTDKSAPFYLGGYEDRIWNLALRLERRNDVSVATSLDEPRVARNGIEFYRCSPTIFQPPPPADRNLAHSAIYSVSLLSNPFHNRPLDVLVVESIPYLQLVTAARWIRNTPFKKVLDVNEAWSSYSYFSGLLERPGNWILRSSLARGIGWADMVASISNVTKRSLESSFHARNVQIVPMGIDPELVDVGSPAAGSEPTYDFVTISRLVSIKRVHEFLSALSVLKSDFNWNGKAAVIGDGRQMSYLQRLAIDLGIAAQVCFMGMVPTEVKFRTLRASRVFVLCSEREGFSLATLEAMACGIPPIVARPPNEETYGVSDIVSSGRSGLEYNLGDVHGLARTMENLLTDEPRRKQLGDAARLTAGAYTWSRISDQFELELRRMCTGP